MVRISEDSTIWMNGGEHTSICVDCKKSSTCHINIQSNAIISICITACERFVGKTIHWCYNWNCQNFVKRDGTEFEYSPDAYGQIGKCKFERLVSKRNDCGKFTERKEKLHTNLAVVRAAIKFDNCA
jgi:hypothetical protein